MRSQNWLRFLYFRSKMTRRIEVKPGEPLDRALKRFKRMCNNAGILSDYKKHTVFEKPSERRRRKAKAKLKTIRKAQQEKENLQLNQL